MHFIRHYKYVFFFMQIILLSSVSILNAQDKKEEKKTLKNLNFKAYGVVNYYGFDWDTDQQRRNVFDTERLNTYIYYDFNKNIQAKAEIEFEHGGTGVTMELDKFEEFGEYEVELEAGGEVKIDQLNVLFRYKPWLNFRLGRVELYLGNFPKLDTPTRYFTGQLSPTENALLPIGWYENGIEVSGNLGVNKKWEYKLYFVNGLSSVGFTSANWIKRGLQQRFETINAQSFAGAFRLDYLLPNRSYIGISGYMGGSNDNRPKPDLETVDGTVTLADFHFNIEKKKWTLRGMLIYGNIQNSEAITIKNKNLSNNLNVKRTPVAKNALGYYLMFAYDILSFIKNTKNKKFYLFGRYDFYDSMYQTEGNVLKNPRWERKAITFGANFFFNPNIVLKTQYTLNTLGADTLDGYNNIIGNKERTFLVGLAFNFSTIN